MPLPTIGEAIIPRQVRLLVKSQMPVKSHGAARSAITLNFATLFLAIFGIDGALGVRGIPDPIR